MKILTTIDLLALPSLETPPTGHVGFGAKADGLYQKIGTVETKLSVDGHVHSAVTTSVAGFMSAADKVKLNGIATGANAYVHPTGAGNNHIPTGGAAGQFLKWSSSGVAVWAADNNTTYGVATTSANGLMSAADKVKLDGVATGANNYSHPAYTSRAAGLYKVTVDASGHVSAVAAVAKADITGLGIPAQDTVYTHPSSHPATIITQTSSYRFVTDTEKSTWNAKSNLALGTTSTTAYRGDLGAIAYNHSQATGNPHGVTASLVGAYTKAETNEEIDKAKSTNHGYRYSYNLWMYGDHDKYYPFVIAGGDQNVKRDILVKRSYSEIHPPEWNSPTHGGGLTLKLKTNFGGWGGANYGWEIHELEEMYNPTFGGCYHTTSYMTFSIMLRGGGTGGAIYHIYSDMPIETTHGLHLNGDGNTSSNFPQVFYNKEVLQYIATTSTWAMSTPLTTPNTEDIRRRKFIKLVQDIDTLVGKTTGISSLNITGNAATATTATNLNRSIVAGNGLTDGGVLNADRTITLGTPSDITATSTNSVTATSHTHAITTTAVGAASTIVQTNANGAIGTSRFGTYGVYSSAQTQGVWGMGLGYMVNATTTGLGTLYGLGYSYISVGGSSFANEHQIHFASNGTAFVSISLSTGKVKATTFIGALTGNADTATTATKLGTATVGSTQLPFYLNAGTATAITQAGLRIGLFGATAIGSATKPVYIAANGIPTASTSFGGVTGIGTASPLMDGTVAVGTSSLAARQDHRHPVDTSRAAVAQTMYIGTTAVAINRASATLNLTGIGTLAMGGALSGATTIAASTSVTTPKVIFAAAGWSVEQSGTEIQFKYNGVIKQRLLSDGAIVATNEITAFG